ncbi:PREDICTED: yrdC domain-containing protein, mitochondrial-like isoform X2 [Priapulus caudatus]|uniref:Threonylcarbamoyl-AMP synthase n=1 Tax=Priapulus caudatus TaxID=37621 RepID=A0ABM1F9A2_PRICU|nr:PREDICTED: yrdC domain-containing protein, mitochondrial-like isoform X2 [Priapulus caudatus]
MTKLMKLSPCDFVGELLLAVNILRRGGVVAFPTDTVYGIATLAQDTRAVNKLYNVKGRDFVKPVAICVGQVADISKWAKITVSRKLLDDLLPGPVTIVLERTPLLNPQLNPKSALVGVRVPDDMFARQLAQECGEPLALTSANLSNEEFQCLWPKLDLIIDGGPISVGEDSRQGSTVIDLSHEGFFKIIRNGTDRSYRSTVEVLVEKYSLQELVK